MALGVYLHIPYCRHLCPYCDFNVHVRKSIDWEYFFAALKQELAARSKRFDGLAMSSFYAGGGTPSLAPAAYYADFFDLLSKQFQLDEAGERTIEVEPGTLSKSELRALKHVGFNRISVGWQSTHDTVLKKLGRLHNAHQAQQLLEWGLEQDFQSVSADIIFGVPGQSLEQLEQDLDTLLDVGVPHISTYELTYHRGTEFWRRLQQGKIYAADEETLVTMSQLIESRLTERGYTHYEVSNYALNGHQGKHNQGYWRGQSYLGLGPGACGLWQQDRQQGFRWENLKSPERYADVWNRGVKNPWDNGSHHQSCEHLDQAALLRERIMTAMRTQEGIGKVELSKDAALKKALEQGWVEEQESSWVPTSEGMLHADALAVLLIG